MRTVLPALMLLSLTVPVLGDWPQYLGPTGDSVSTETGLLDAWPEEGPREVWRIEVGPGYGGAAIVGDQAFILDREHGTADILRVLDLATGEDVWSHRYDAEGRVGHEGSRCTPAVTDTQIFTTGQLGHLYAFNREQQDVAWSVNLLEAYPDADQNDGQNWGYGMNPLVVGEVVVVASPARETPGLIAFNQSNGEVVWESEAFGDSNMYCSPHLRTIAGVTGICIRTIRELWFIDPTSGETIFRHPCYNNGRIPITPVTVMPDERHVFVTQGYEMGSVMIRVNRTAAGAWLIEDVYRAERGSQIHPGIVVGEHLYVNHTENDTSRRPARHLSSLACVDPGTGEVLWNTGNEPFIGRGATLYADEKLIVQDAETGLLLLVDPSPEGFELISSFQAVDASTSKAWGPLALSGGMLIVRDQNEMVCFDLSADE